MTYLFDMVHHNPGESPFDTNFTDPTYLAHYGFNGQVFKHVHCLATLEAVAPGIFPTTPEEIAWLEAKTAELQGQMRAAKEAGLAVYSHVDLFVLPQAIVEHFKDDICDAQTGRILLDCPKTKELHQALIAELFARFPELDGLIIRVGETYLHDTPHHAGNGAVSYASDDYAAQQQQFVELIRFLRTEICERHDKLCLFRTWDTYPDRFHASKPFYLAITEAVEPHEKLIFLIKHTVVDFHRWVAPNPCLLTGKHSQIIEVQCQREYEGKGAYPNYSTHGVINGFSEPRQRHGLRDLLPNPAIKGLFTWTRGGGWYGPYIDKSNELWSDLNAYVLAQYALDPTQSEEQIFSRYASEILHLNEADQTLFRKIALLSLDGVLKGKCCAGWDSRDDIPDYHYPTNQWMRDDVLHGYDLLEPVFAYLIENHLVEAAIQEKQEAVAVWQEMAELAERLACDPKLKAVIVASCQYGLRLFSFIAAAWELLLTAQHQQTKDGELEAPRLGPLLEAADQAWAQYQQLPEQHPAASTLYRLHGWSWPGKPPVEGLGASIEQIRDTIA